MAYIFGAIDKKAQREGKWFNYDEDTKIKLAFIGDPKVSSLVDFNSSALEDVKETDTPEERVVKLEAIAQDRAMKISKFVLLDWDGVLDIEGEPVPYSPELGYQALVDDQTFFSWVMKNITNQSAFNREIKFKKAKK